MQSLSKILLLILSVVASSTLSAAPVVYSINSDSGSGDAEGLYRIDLTTGIETRIGTVQSGFVTRIDVEGLAFAPDKTLYGVDDEALTLFPIDRETAAVDSTAEVHISGLPSESNDFGMTFACDNNLYLTSVARRSLYSMSLDGDATLIGSEGSLGVKISALASFGNPVRLFGLGNGIDKDGNVDTPNLYEINTTTGVATAVGPLGAEAADYSEGGLAFDDSGQLWAITDRRQLSAPSQVMKIDIATGSASRVMETAEQGFESLAITEPGGCADASDSGGGYIGVPTLNLYGLLLVSLLTLLTGAIAIRRL
jgi:hypothetical protein